MEGVTDLEPFHITPDFSSKDTFLDQLANALVAWQRADNTLRIAIGTWILEAKQHFAPKLPLRHFCNEISGELVTRGVSFNGETLRGWSYIAKHAELSSLAGEHGVSVVLSSMKRGESSEQTANRVETAVAIAGERGMDRTQAARVLTKMPWAMQFGIPRFTRKVEKVTVIRADGRTLTDNVTLVITADDGGTGICAFVATPGADTPVARGAALLLDRAHVQEDIPF